jgi:hypothetical protein
MRTGLLTVTVSSADCTPFCIYQPRPHAARHLDAHRVVGRRLDDLVALPSVPEEAEGEDGRDHRPHHLEHLVAVDVLAHRAVPAVVLDGEVDHHRGDADQHDQRRGRDEQNRTVDRVGDVGETTQHAST